MHHAKPISRCKTNRESPSPGPVQLPIHHLPPPRSEPPHRPHDDAARRGDEAHPREQPPVADGADQRLRHDGARAGEDVAHEVVDRDAVGGAAGHELGEHGGRHGEDEHGADAEEEVGDERDGPGDALVGRPAVPHERGRVEEGGDPGVLAHAVFGPVHQFALVVVAAGALGFAGHDPVGPFAAEEGGGDVADGVGDVGQADEGGGEAVGRLGEGGYEGDVEEVQGAEGDAGVVDGDEDGGEAEVEDDFQGVDEDAFGGLDGVCGSALNALAGGGAAQVQPLGGEVLFGVWSGRFDGFESLTRYH